MKIKNFNELAVSPLREAALRIAEAGYSAIDTKQAVRGSVKLAGDLLRVRGQSFPLAEFRRVFVVGVGKCAVDAAEELELILGDRLTGGIVIDVKTSEALKKIEHHAGTHPLPTAPNVEAAARMVALLQSLEETDFVIFIISGGGSTLLCLPDDKGCEEEAKVFTALTAAGATIQEINTVRKHLSLARGGYLAKHAHPAHSVALIFSDVPGDELGFIASGPTVKDETTIAEAEAVLAKYEVLMTCGIEHCGLVETPKEDIYFERVQNILLVSNALALEAMATTARELGFRPQILGSDLAGEVRATAAGVLAQLRASPKGTALLAGGETTVVVRGPGRGGRNREFALAMLEDIREGELLLSLASDGRDNGEWAGAVCDTITLVHAREKGLDPASFLAESDAAAFFEKCGDQVETGNTGSNVSDFIIAITNT